MRNIRHLVLSSIAAVAFVGMTVGIGQAATGGYTGVTQCGNITTPSYKEAPSWSSDGSVGAGATGPTATMQSRSYQSGQATGGYAGVTQCENVGTPTWSSDGSVGAGASGPTEVLQSRSYQSGQATGGYTGVIECENVATPCYEAAPSWSSDGSVGAGTRGAADRP